jgi:hypothetical protein
MNIVKRYIKVREGANGVFELLHKSSNNVVLLTGVGV